MASLSGMRLGGCELLEELGQGGMGLIYKARQLSLDRVVAVKILAEHLAHNPSFVERFQREARAIARVNHTNILAVYDVGFQDPYHYMLIELIDGGSLGEYLAKRGALDPWEAAEIVLQAARGLECAAASNIIHRDVKPENIMLTSRRVVKVSDFGLAKELDGTMTETQAVMGTPAYMSPEQCDGRDLDSRTDIYSLGGTFYRCVTGRLPFEAETAMSMMYRHKHAALTPPDKIVPTLPASLSEVICKMMAKDRAERYQSMTQVIEALEAARKSGQAAFDPGRTVPVNPSSPAETDSRVMAAPSMIPGSDSRVIARPTSPREIEDTAARCKKSARSLVAQGKYTQAARELRRLLEVSPGDAEAKSELRDIERRANDKRSGGAEIRAMVSAGSYEEALLRWKAMPEELRDETIAKQIEHLERSVVPSLKLAAKAEAAVASGSLEEAARLFAKALEADPASEKAKVGAKNLERTRQRIEFLLKEGYGHRQNRDYAQAVIVWEKVLSAEPGNSQARRLIVEARLAAASEAFSLEDFEKATANYEALLKLDPENGEARAALAEAVIKRDRTAELRRTAQMAHAKGDMAASARAWQDLTSIMPKNRVAREGLESARRSLSLKRAKLWGCVLAVLVLAVVGFLIWRNFGAMGRARQAFSGGRYEECETAAGRVWLPGLKAEAAELARKALHRRKRDEAEAAARAGQWARATASMQEAIAAYGQGPDLDSLNRKLNQYRVSEHSELARQAESRGAWRVAEEKYLLLRQYAKKAEMPEEVSRADLDWEFCGAMANGLEESTRREPGWKERAGGCYRKALQLRPGSPEARQRLQELAGTD